MTDINEIKAAIENLPPPQVDQLANWLEAYRHPLLPVERWLQHARGAALAGVKTQDIMTITRGEE